MAGKEAIVFLVDVHRSMAKHMELARKVTHMIMVQKMVQSKANEMGVVLFGLPAEETNNRLNEEDEELYQGLQEFNRLEPGNVTTLRKLKEMDVPDEDAGELHGDLLDAMIVGVDMIRQRTNKRKYARHVYILTDGAAPVSDPQMIRDVVNMYLDPSLQCKLHFVGFGPEGVVKEEPGGEGKRSIVEVENEKMLASAAAATDGTVMLASSVVNALGEATIKQVAPTLSKVEFSIGTKLRVHCRYFKKTDTKNEHLKRESLASKPSAGDTDEGGKVRLNRIYRDPEMPEVELEFKDQVKGYRYGQDVIPVNEADEEMLALPREDPSLKALGFVPSSSVKRHLFMDDTFVVIPEPASRRASVAVTALVEAMRNLHQVAVVRFVRKAGSEPWLGVLMADSTGVAPQERFLFQRLPFSDDLRDYSFPSFKKAPVSRRPSEAQLRVSASLVDAMMIPEHPAERSGLWGALPLNPLKQGILRLKVARAMDPECDVPLIHPSVLANVNPSPELLEGAAPVLERYLKEFTFTKQEKAKPGKKRVAYFSDLALAEVETSSGAPADKDIKDEQRSPKGQKRSRTEISDVEVKAEDVHGASEKPGFNAQASQQPPLKVGSINPVGDFEKMIAAAKDADEDGADLAERAVEQMQSMIHTLVKKGFTSAIRSKAVGCVKALRRACVSHFMGNNYNDFLAKAKAKYEGGDHSDFWETVQDETEMWPITREDDASLTMTAEEAAELMKKKAKEEDEEREEDGADDDDLDDLA